MARGCYLQLNEGGTVDNDGTTTASHQTRPRLPSKNELRGHYEGAGEGMLGRLRGSWRANTLSLLATVGRQKVHSRKLHYHT